MSLLDKEAEAVFASHENQPASAVGVIVTGRIFDENPLVVRDLLAACFTYRGMLCVASDSDPLPHLAHPRRLFDRSPLFERVVNDNLAC